MVAMPMPDPEVKSFIGQVKADYPQFRFRRGRQDHWSPGSNMVIYNDDRPLVDLQYGLLHELSHALLAHKNYSGDFELLKLEAEAWAMAAKIGSKYGIAIDEDHVQNCLDTYRDWLHRRSTCPSCGMHVFQEDPKHYACFNCQTRWSVGPDRFARSYRKLSNKKTA